MVVWSPQQPVGPSKYVLVYALHSLENVLGLTRFRVFVSKLLYYKGLFIYLKIDIPLIIIEHVLVLLISFKIKKWQMVIGSLLVK